MRPSLVFVLLPLVALAACDANGPTMKPGENCKGCHNNFSIAGTVFPSPESQAGDGLAGVTVSVVDAAAKTISMTSNSVGNFYSEEAVTWPATITLTLGTRTASMQNGASGACASCHNLSASGQGRVYLP